MAMQKIRLNALTEKLNIVYSQLNSIAESLPAMNKGEALNIASKSINFENLKEAYVKYNGNGDVIFSLFEGNRAVFLFSKMSVQTCQELARMDIWGRIVANTNYGGLDPDDTETPTETFFSKNLKEKLEVCAKYAEKINTMEFFIYENIYP